MAGRVPTPALLGGALLLGILLLVVAPPPARAQEAPQRSVLPLKILSDALGDDQARALTGVLVELLGAYPDLEILDPPEQDVIDMLFELDCIEPDVSCLAALGDQRGAALTFLATVVRSGGGLALSYKVVDAERKTLVDGGEISAASTSELGGAMEQAVRSAFGAPPPPKPREVRLLVEANVEGARVHLGGREVGTTPVRIEVEPGRYGLRVQKEGYEPHVETIVVEPERPFVTRVALQPRQVVAPVAPVTAAEAADEPPSDERKPVYKRWWFWTVIGAAVVGGTAAAIAAASSDGGPSGTGVFVLNPGEAERDAIFSSP